ncbi:MAG: hypothetical protein IT464_13240 [Planctomycetes bacterium]|nr:hypothetical protein [Planctomycetota bacterium]
MFRLMLVALLFSASLAAEDLEFKPLMVSPSSGNINPSSLLITWDKPDTEPKKLEVFIFHTAWMVAPSVEEVCPKWREFLFAENFDAEAFRKANGPETTRYHIEVKDNHLPLGVIGHEEEYRIRNVHVLFIDAEGKRSLPVNLKASVEAPELSRADCYYLPNYLPYFTQTRLFDKKPSKLKWKLPELGPAYEIEKVLFVGAENMINSFHVSRVKDGFAGWIAGNDDYSKPMVQELAKDATSCWIKTLNFKSCIVVAVTKCGLRFGCKLETQGTSYEAQASADDQKALPAIELKPVEAAKPD